LFPPSGIRKEVTQPQRLAVRDNKGDAKTHVLPAGTKISFNIPGIHYNEKYWADPYKVDISRWTVTSVGSGDSAAGINIQPTKAVRGAFVGFAEGPRSCMGKKFAHAQTVGFLTTILRNFTIRFEVPHGVSQKKFLQQMEFGIFHDSGGDLVLRPVPEHKKPLRLDKRPV
jgi:cytochrome P450